MNITRNREGSISTEVLFIAIITVLIGFKVNAKLFIQGVVVLSLLAILANIVMERYNSRKNKCK